MFICVVPGSYRNDTRVGTGETLESAYTNAVNGDDESDYPIEDCEFYEGAQLSVEVQVIRNWSYKVGTPQ